MKNIVIIISLIVTAHAADHSLDKDELEVKEYFEQCLSEHGLKESDLEELKNKADPQILCITACVFEKQGLLMKNGEFNKKEIIKVEQEEDPNFKQDDFDEIFSFCEEKAKGIDDACLKGNTLTMCFLDEISQLDDKN
ncbi:pheromone-binding protein Gp-9-like [Trichogramma pretiosum]|uniref:pheromone-binding protein Gp-9-like n=1 Tax=Trichogramma pretiosum TaxID=7493 RepID=UPI0006C93FB8|nr:pheromone-binding protein Gp-9-like [Trichogramma pretiosum]